MKHTLVTALLLTLAGACPGPAATFYWDANGTSGLGGTGTWDDGVTANWNPDSSGAGTLTTWNNANRDTADFRGTAGTVTVSGGVTAAQLLFNAGGYTLGGSAIHLGRASGTGDATLLNYASGTGDLAVSNDLVIDDVGSVGSSLSYIFQSATGNALTFNGSIGINYGSGTPAGLKTISFRGNHASSVFTINGSVGATPSGTTSRLQILGHSDSLYLINGANAALSNSTSGQVVRGTALLGHAQAMGSNSIQIGVSSTAAGDRAALLTNGALTVANNLSLGNAHATSQLIVGGNTADVSEFSGTVNVGFAAQTLRVSAADGGRVNFTGSISGGGTGTVIKEGNGVAAFARAAGNSYARDTSVDAGTLLLMNTSGSATGTGSVSVAGGAVLGGTGSAAGAVIAADAGSVFSPGDIGGSGSLIGQLTLGGGLTAANGATFAFDLDGAFVDTLDFGAGLLDLDGVATFNFTSLGSVNTGVAYSLFAGTGDWSASSASFSFNGPAGYVLDTSYGGGSGYIWDAAGHSLTVQFAAVPEPSAMALLAAGLAGMLGRRRGGGTASRQENGA